MDKRRYKRYSVKKGGIVSLQMGSETRLGLITDVSRGGIGFRYVADDHPPRGHKNAALEIIYGQDGFFLDNIPARVVNDSGTESEFSFQLLPIRRCGVCFDKLSPDKEREIDYFINRYSKTS